MTLVGFVNIPIIKFSVEWWNTLHQPASVLRLDGPTIHPSLLWPLLISALGVHRAVLHAASGRHANGNLAAARRRDAAGGGPARGWCPMSAHALYVTAAYGLTALVLSGLVVWMLADQRARRRELAQLEASGLRRRSDRPAEREA